MELSLVSGGAPAVDSRAFRRALGQFATGVTVVTAQYKGTQVGVTANSFASVSLNPPLVLWSLSKSSTSYDTFASASHYGVNILARSQTDISARFANSSPDKFVGVSWTKAENEVPLIDGATVHLVCRTKQQIDGGDHTIFLGEVENYLHFDVEPLLFTKGAYSLAMGWPVGAPNTAPYLDATHPDTTLLHLLLRAYEELSPIFDEYRAEEGLSFVQSRILAFIARNGSADIQDIVQASVFSEGVAADAIGALISKHLVSEVQNCQFVLTDSGEALQLKLRRKFRDIEHGLLAEVPGLDIDSMRHLVAAIGTAAHGVRRVEIFS